MDEEEIPIVEVEAEKRPEPKSEPEYYDDPDEYQAVAEDLDYEPLNNPMNSSTS